MSQNFKNDLGTKLGQAQNVYWLTPPPPLSTDVICTWPLIGIMHPIIARVQVCINAPIWPSLDRWRSRSTSVRPFSRAPPQFRAISCYERKPVPVPLRKQPLDLWPSLPGPRSGWPARGECLSDGRADAVACVALVVAAVHPPAREGLGSGGGVFCGVPVRPLGDVKERG